MLKNHGTLHELLHTATTRLTPASETPRLDAELLLAHVLNIPRATLLARLREPASPNTLDDLIDRRLAGEPIAYITGEWEFFSLPLYTQAPILVPRPETEHLVEAVLEFIGDNPAIVVDTCVGTACVAIAIAINAPNARVIANDIAPEAVELAQRNIARHNLLDRITLLRASLLDALPTGANVDVVCANPPYIAENEWQTLMPSVRCFEDPRALLAGPDGLDCIRTLVNDAQRVLRPLGCLAFEFGYGQRDAVESLLQAAGYMDIAIRFDFAGIPRVATALAP